MNLELMLQLSKRIEIAKDLCVKKVPEAMLDNIAKGKLVSLKIIH
jgi:hypothetical protein